jgi:nondiscriminating aspartyl-tRNA synthetase
VRILSSEVKGQIGKTVTLKGWLHKKRAMGGINFINIRDRQGLTQVVVQDKKEVEKLRGMQIGTVLEVNGKAVKEDRAPGGAEVHDPKITIISACMDESPIEIDKQLSHKSEHLDTLFDNRVIGLRNLDEQTIFKVQATVAKAIRDYFEKQNFTEIRTPKLLSKATEGGAEVFTLDYFDKTATLAQSPQFYKQIMVGVFERVYEIAPVYRAEPSATTRHMTEYISVDGEMGFVNVEDLKITLSELLNSIVDKVWNEHERGLKKWNASKPILPKLIPTISLEEVHQKYSKATGQNTLNERDLRPDEERWICEYAKKQLGSEALFVSDWPASDMKFYHKKNDQNPEFAERLDLLFRGVEIVTASMREHRYETLVKQLKEMAKGSPDVVGYVSLLSAMKYGMPPHGGFGMGLERVTQKIMGLNNIKEASLFPRDMNRLNP